MTLTIGLTGLMKSLLKKEKSIHKLQGTAAIKYQLRPFVNKINDSCKWDNKQKRFIKTESYLFCICKTFWSQVVTGA